MKPCPSHQPAILSGDSPVWPSFAELVAEACGVPAAAVARREGAKIRLAHTVGMAPVSWAFGDEQQAADALERMGSPSSNGEFNAGWPASTAKTFQAPDKTTAGALCLFTHTTSGFPLHLLSRFARHAEHLLEYTEWGTTPDQSASEITAQTPLEEPTPSLLKIFENSALPVFFWTADNHLVDTNQAGVELLGYPREDYREGRITWSSITPPGNEGVAAEMCRRVFTEGAVAPFEWEYLRADGHREFTQIVATLLPGRKDTGVVFVLDMTPQRIVEREMQRAQEALRARERSLRLAIQAGNLGTWNYSCETNQIKWSRRCQDIFGIGPRQLATYEEFLTAVHAEDRERVKQTVRHALDPSGEGNCEIEFRILRKQDQAQRWVMARAQGFFGELAEQHAANLLIGTLLDITERKASEAELCRARDAAEAANAAKDQFIAKLSHELRTPLTPVLMGIDMLLEQNAADTPLHQHLALMQRNIQLEARIIDDLLDVTRIGHGKLDLRLEEVDLHRLLEDAAGICMPKVKEQDLTVCFRLEAGEHWTSGDPARLEQIFWNLLQNATKFTQPGGVIQITTSNPSPGRIAIAFRDSGIGIDPAVLPELFGAFEQGGTTITQRYGGLGLGLAICKGVIELHGGSIQAFSKGSGLGSTFFVELDTTRARAALPPSTHFPSLLQTPPEDPKKLDQEQKSCPHLLVVEDHPHTGDVMARLLRKKGYAISLARNLVQAKELAAQNRFDLVLSDIGLPDGNGRELMTYLRDKYGLCGIALSGFGTEADAQASLAAGFREHVVKPVAWKQLDAALRRALLPEEGVTAPLSPPIPVD